MSEEILDNLDLDLTGIDTTRKTLVDGKLTARLESITVGDNHDKSGQQLNLIWSTTEQATSEQAKEVGDQNDVPIGFKLRDNVAWPEEDTEYYDLHMKIISSYQDALLDTEQDDRGCAKPREWIGQEAVVSVRSTTSKKDGNRYTNIKFVESMKG